MENIYFKSTIQALRLTIPFPRCFTVFVSSLLVTFWSSAREPDINYHNTAQSLQTSTLLQDLLYRMGAFNHRIAYRLPRSA